MDKGDVFSVNSRFLFHRVSPKKIPFNDLESLGVNKSKLLWLGSNFVKKFLFWKLKRSWSLSNRCYMCMGEEDSINYLLLHSPKAEYRMESHLCYFLCSLGDVVFSQECSHQLVRYLCWEQKEEGFECCAIVLSMVFMEREKPMSCENVEWVKLDIKPHSLSMFDFIKWLGCK